MNIIDLSFCAVLKLNSGDLRFICLEAQTVTEKQFSFKVFFITETGHRPGWATDQGVKQATDQGVKLKLLRGRYADLQNNQGRNMTILWPHWDADATKVVPELYQRHL